MNDDKSVFLLDGNNKFTFLHDVTVLAASSMNSSCIEN